MEFFVYSRGAIERLPPHDVQHVIISITTTADDRAKLPTSAACRGVLRLVFPDFDEPAPNTPSALAGAEHARAIWDFIEQHLEGLERVVLHCDAGVSRSPAVAAALAKCLEGDDSEFFRRYRPNMRVYRALLDEWNERQRTLARWRTRPAPEHDRTVPHVGAHEHSSNHRDAIDASEICGCFYCLSTFPPNRIAEWVDIVEGRGTTALCPDCGIDSVLGSASGLPITRELLAAMRAYWFW